MRRRRSPRCQDFLRLGKRPRGCTARTGWAAIRFPTCWCSAGARDWRRLSTQNGVARADFDASQIEEAEREMLAPFERPPGENPYAIHHDLQNMMQSLVGIFPHRGRPAHALVEIDKFKERRRRVHVEGSRLFNPGWHLARDLQYMLTIAEA